MKCENCNKEMKLRSGATGKFWGCSGYPQCRTTKPYVEGEEQQETQTPQTAKHDIVISRTEKPHSYEFGKAGNRFKVYYGEVTELLEHIEELKGAGLYEEYETIHPKDFAGEDSK